ncbi:MAG: MFS transporter [Prevotellaceae bacterium]|jgi:PAT family beta-lactamase induction signal transducer AmpG|nr:MFS transporter [Prevotellaceae bacterium]
MKHRKRSPWAWIPTLYFAEGLPYVIVMTVAAIMYKRLGVSNAQIALYTGWLYLPWVIKPFWSPFVDLLKTKRWWIFSMQLLIGAGLGGVAFLLPVPFFFQSTLAVFWLIAFGSATHDIAADGFYMLALNDAEQSFFVGIRSTFYRFATITGQGLLIIFAGALESATGLPPLRFEVQSSHTRPTETPHQPPTFNPSEDRETAFLVYPETLVLHTGHISVDSLNRILHFAITNNRAHHFISGDPIHKSSPSSDGTTGNAGLVAVRLSHPPQEEKEVILHTGLLRGDISISLIHGERITFTSENWDKPAYFVLQLDAQLKDETKTGFRGTSGNIKQAWSITFFVLAGLVILLSLYHRFILPRPASDRTFGSQTVKNILREFGTTFTAFFRKKHILLAISFMLSYRLGEALLVKMASLFLLDPRESGGLGLTTGQVGMTYGTFGIIALVAGGIIGGIAISRQGLSYWLWPMALSITLPNLAYIYLSFFQPDNLLYINLAVSIEQFGYGFGFTAYMLYLIYFSDGEHKTAHYAFSTGIMALGMMLPGMFAGWLQEQTGYPYFFLTVIACSLPTLAIIPFMRIDKTFGRKRYPPFREER